MKDDFNARSSGSKQKPPKGKNLPEVVNDIVWARQLHNKVSTYYVLAQVYQGLLTANVD